MIQHYRAFYSCFVSALVVCAVGVSLFIYGVVAHSLMFFVLGALLGVVGIVAIQSVPNHGQEYHEKK